MPIACELYTAILDDKPYYEALSYAWGQPRHRHSIILDDQVTTITANLHNALWQLRPRYHDRHLWVDALCINQADDDEKSRQVDLMKEIYSSTAQATLWLGGYSDAPALPSSRQYPEDDSQLDSDVESVPNNVSRETARAAFSLLESMAKGDHFNNREDRDLAKKNIDSLGKILQLPWWHRIWTVQEAVLPKKAILTCGTKKTLH